MSNSFSDYPDYMAQDLWVVPPLDYSMHNAVANGSTLGPFFVANMPAVAFLLPASAGLGGYVGVSVFQWADVALTKLVSSTTYYLPAGRFIKDVIPVQGVYMTLQFAGQAAPQNIDLALVPCRNLSAANIFTNAQELQTAFNTAVGAGATVILPVTGGVGCKALWTVTTTCTDWTSRLQAFQVGAAAYKSVVGAMNAAQSGKGDSRVVNLPTAACDWLFTNLDAVGGTFSGAIVLDRLGA